MELDKSKRKGDRNKIGTHGERFKKVRLIDCEVVDAQENTQIRWKFDKSKLLDVRKTIRVIQAEQEAEEGAKLKRGS